MWIKIPPLVISNHGIEIYWGTCSMYLFEIEKGGNNKVYAEYPWNTICPCYKYHQAGKRVVVVAFGLKAFLPTSQCHLDFLIAQRLPIGCLCTIINFLFPEITEGEIWIST